MTGTVGTPNVATVLAVTSGKGGVGKTNVTVNVALSLARLGYRVGLIDADFGLGNIDVMLGLTPESHLGHLLAGEKTLAEIVIRGPLGVEVIPASSGLQSITSMTSAQRSVLRDDAACVRVPAGFPAHRHCGRHLRQRRRDVATRRTRRDRHLARAIGRRRCVRHREGSDADLARDRDWRDRQRGARWSTRRGWRSGNSTSRRPRFLGRSLRYYGFVAEDRAVRESVLVQRAVVDHLPQAAASRCFRILASRLAGLGRGPGGLRLAVGASTRKPTEVSRCA